MCLKEYEAHETFFPRLCFQPYPQCLWKENSIPEPRLKVASAHLRAWWALTQTDCWLTCREERRTWSPCSQFYFTAEGYGMCLRVRNANLAGLSSGRWHIQWADQTFSKRYLPSVICFALRHTTKFALIKWKRIKKHFLPAGFCSDYWCVPVRYSWQSSHHCCHRYRL